MRKRPMKYVMALTKPNDQVDHDQPAWQVLTFAEDPRLRGIKIGDTYHVLGEPQTFQWKIADIFPEESR